MCNVSAVSEPENLEVQVAYDPEFEGYELEAYSDDTDDSSNSVSCKAGCPALGCYGVCDETHNPGGQHMGPHHCNQCGNYW